VDEGVPENQKLPAQVSPWNQYADNDEYKPVWPEVCGRGRQSAGSQQVVRTQQVVVSQPGEAVSQAVGEATSQTGRTYSVVNRTLPSLRNHYQYDYQYAGCTVPLQPCPLEKRRTDEYVHRGWWGLVEGLTVAKTIPTPVPPLPIPHTHSSLLLRQLRMWCFLTPWGMCRGHKLCRLYTT
jgi:hypothetical protein